MSELCPLIDEQGVPKPVTGDKFGAVWDSGLSALCMQRCFNVGHDRAISLGTVETEVFASQEEQLLAEGDTGAGEGIIAEDRIHRTGFIEIDDGTDPEALLSSSKFSFICNVRNNSK